MVASLNDLDEESRPVLERLCKQLQQIALLVVVNQNAQLLDVVQVLLNRRAEALQTLAQVIVVRRWDREELSTASLHTLDRVQHTFSAQSDVLNAGASVILNIFLNLRFPHASGWLVDWHLDFLIEVRDDDRPQGRVLGVQHLVVDRPKAVKVQHLLIPGGGGLHLTVGLVADTVVNKEELRLRNQLIDRLLEMVCFKAGKEGPGVLRPVDKSVSGVAVCSDSSNDDCSVVVLQRFRLADRHSTALDGFLENACRVIDGEGDVLHAVAVFGVVRVKFFLSFGYKWRLECEDDLAVGDDVSGVVAVAGLETLIGEELEAESASVVARCLLGVSNPEGHMVEAKKLTNFGAHSGFLVIYHLRFSIIYNLD